MSVRDRNLQSVLSILHQHRSSSHDLHRAEGEWSAMRVRRRRRAFLTVGVLLVLQMVPSPVAGQKESAGEYELKAAMLYNLTNFVDWPVSVYPDARKAIF